MKHIAIVKYVLIAISVITILLGAVVSDNVDLMLRWGYVMFGLAVACVVLLPLYTLAQNPKGALRSLAGLVIVLVIVGVSYAVGSDATIVTPSNTYDDAFQLKVSDAGLYTTYVAFVGAIVVILYGEVRNFFK